MKRGLKLLCGWGLLAAWAAGTAACAGEEAMPPREEKMVQQEVLITAGTATMTLEGMPSTRSLEPMGPELENPIKHLAVIQFDEEGNLLRLNSDESAVHPYFYWRDFTDEGRLPGNLVITEADNFAVPLYIEGRTRVCLLGNLSEEIVDSLLWKDDNLVSWADFLDKTVPVDYILTQDDPGGEVGQVREIRLFGYYEGTLAGSSPQDNGETFLQMDFTLARLIARLELSIRLGEGVELPKEYNLYWSLKGAEKDIYLFPNEERTDYIHTHVDIPPLDRTVYMREHGEGTFYFYIAPHLVLADHKKDATYLQIWCTKETNPDSLRAEDAREVLICNDPLQETPTAAGSLWINRNSIYHMDLTLTYKGTETQSKAVPGEECLVPVIPRCE